MKRSFMKMKATPSDIKHARRSGAGLRMVKLGVLVAWAASPLTFPVSVTADVVPASRRASSSPLISVPIRMMSNHWSAFLFPPTSSISRV
jgi:hypothetical protein